LHLGQILYGENSILSIDKIGTLKTIEQIKIEDLKNYYEKNFSPTLASFLIAGNIKKEVVIKSLQDLSKSWKKKNVVLPQFKDFPIIDKSGIYFVDVPGAKQSVINIGYLALITNKPGLFSSYCDEF
jgi:zinc protease